MKKIAYIFALVLLILGGAACGSEPPNYKQEAREYWKETPQKEKDSVCAGYHLLGAELLEERVRAETDQSDAEIGAKMNILREEC